jgi:hypothetical protein
MTESFSGSLSVGDRVKGNYKNSDIGNITYTGTIVLVREMPDYDEAYVDRDDKENGGDPIIGHEGGTWIIRRTKNTDITHGYWGADTTRGHIDLLSTSTFGGCMNIKGNFILSLVKEPNKSFRKAEITDNNDLLTDDGQKIFLSWLLHSKYAEEFKASVVDEMVQDKKTEGK